MAVKPKFTPPIRKAVGNASARPGSSGREGKGVKVEQEVIDRIVSGVLEHLEPGTVGDWFGPNQPLRPIAQEQAVGRLRDYATGFNLQHKPRHQESNIEFSHLRALADNCDILRLVLETRKDQIEAIDWKIKAKEGCTVDAKDLAQVTAFFMQPSTEADWSSWIRQILEDLFVIDAVALYPRLTLGGSLYSLDVMDAATIKRLIDEGGRTPIPPEPAYQQMLKGVPAVNYTTDELIYFMRNPRSHKFYGYSPVEQIITYVNMAIRKALHQLEYYTEGNIPESIAGVPDTWTTEQIKEFQMYWDALIEGNTAIRRKMRFVPLDPTKIKETRQVDLKDQFDEWIARVVCYAFSVSPSAFVKDQNRATAETIAENAKLEGLIPVLRFLKRRNDLVIAKYIGRSDMEFSWELNEAIDAKTQAEVDNIYVTMKAITPDWVRKERFGLPPMTAEEKEAAFPAPPNPMEALLAAGGQLPPGADENDEGAAAGESDALLASQGGGGGKVPPQLQQGRKSPNTAPKNNEDPLQRFIGKLVIAPTINVPERSVTVGDVNVHAHVPSQPKEN